MAQTTLSAQLHNDSRMLWPEGLTITLALIRAVYLHRKMTPFELIELIVTSNR